MVKLKFAEHLKEAVTYIEQGHVRVGPDAVTDPAFLVTRNMEDFITWVDSSKIKRKVMEYNDALDDYDAMFWENNSAEIYVPVSSVILSLPHMGLFWTNLWELSSAWLLAFVLHLQMWCNFVVGWRHIINSYLM